MSEPREWGGSPQDLGHHFPCTSPRGHLFPIQQPYLQPSLCMHDQQLPLPCSPVRTRSQSNINNKSGERKELRFHQFVLKYWFTDMNVCVPDPLVGFWVLLSVMSCIVRNCIPEKEWLDHPEIGTTFHSSSSGQSFGWNLASRPKIKQKCHFSYLSSQITQDLGQQRETISMKLKFYLEGPIIRSEANARNILQPNRNSSTPLKNVLVNHNDYSY